MPRKRRAGMPRWLQITVITGLVLLIAAILLVKDQGSSPPLQGMLPEAQLEVALSTSQPTVVFFHSLTCDPCMRMMEIVEQVYPEFSSSIALVDVNVSDTRNHPLLRQHGIRVIPSLVYYDQTGQSETQYGVIDPLQFRQQLQTLAGQSR